MTEEHKVKDDIKKYFAAIPGVWVYMIVPTGYSRKGVPDFIGCYKGRMFAIEAKSAKGKVSSWQQREIDAINDAGGLAFVAQAPNHLETIRTMFEKHILR